MSCWRTCVLTLVLLSPSGIARAYRPFDGTDAAVAKRGEFEADVAPVGYLRAGSLNYVVAPNMVLNFGLHDRFELVVEVVDFILAGSRPVDVARVQLGDSGVFLKGVLRRGTLQGDSGPSIGAEIGPIWPSLWPDPQFGGSAAVIASMRWPALSVHLNHEARLGIALGQVPGQSNLTLLQEDNLIVEGPDAWPVRPVTELLVDYTPEGLVAKSVLLGCLWPLSEAWTFDFGARMGDETGERQIEVRAGVTWLISMLSDAGQDQGHSGLGRGGAYTHVP